MAGIEIALPMHCDIFNDICVHVLRTWCLLRNTILYYTILYSIGISYLNKYLFSINKSKIILRITFCIT